MAAKASWHRNDVTATLCISLVVITTCCVRRVGLGRQLMTSLRQPFFLGSQHNAARSVLDAGGYH